MLVTTADNTQVAKNELPRMKAALHAGCFNVDGKDVAVVGKFPRIAKLHAEYHEYIENPEGFIAALKEAGVRADIFTFAQPVSDIVPRYSYCQRGEPVAVLHIETYEKWWKQQVNDKTRNMVRKPGKKGVVIRAVEFDDELARGIYTIYNESPLIQGRPSKHYGKSFETLKKAHETFLDQSLFIGAFYENKLIGFIKMILHPNKKSVSLMQIMSLVAHRDKSPTNGLLGKAIELCAEKGITTFQYGVWSRRSLGDFKKHHGFQREELPRYFVPLNARGRFAMALGLHRNIVEFVPGCWQDAFANLRMRWYAYKYRARA